MRIVDRKTFLAMPEGTIFAKYDPSVIREPMVKAESIGSEGELFDFRYTSLTDEVDCSGSFERDGIMDLAEIEGTPFALHFNTQCRDGLFDADQLFAVWDRDDVEGLISRLQSALAQGYAVTPAVAPRESQATPTNPVTVDIGKETLILETKDKKGVELYISEWGGVFMLDSASDRTGFKCYYELPRAYKTERGARHAAALLTCEKLAWKQP
ncbi:hypothetical protein WG29040_23280 [Pseudomonas sp. PAMC 29040]|uniref:hypothetical protein n=1 Tax=Pseudomonas sp. PAMC 29040 TaxID=2498450 RepID=UPI000F98D791|nr:hypothetical protein [Pseudomonas sp. PAMC 29040]RUT30864.1 hypothetical protein WG29040_23280 [Pseudomonas sp. PAMC 29040]